MVLLLTDVFLLLTQILLWLLVGFAGWFILLQVLPRAFLSLLVLLLILVVLVISFVGGPPADGGVLEVLWRIISFPFTPLGLGIILLWVLLSGTKLSTLWRRVFNVVLILLLLASTPLGAYFLARGLEFDAIAAIQPTPALTAGARRVIVLMGDGTTRAQLRPPRDTRPTATPQQAAQRPISPAVFDILTRLPTQLTEKGDRLLYAAQLYQDEARVGTNPLVVVSAGTRTDRLRKDGESRQDVSEGRDIQTFLISQGVPAGAILISNDGSTIRSEAERVQQLLRDQRVDYGNSLMVVTSAINTGRTVMTFEDVFPGTAIIARPTDFYTLPPPESLRTLVRGRDLVERETRVTDILPSADAFYLSSQALDEYFRSLFYFLRGWIKPFQRRP